MEKVAYWQPLSIIILSLGLFISCTQASRVHSEESGMLYRIIQNGKTGFIDGRGRVVIKPQFLIAYPFSEGLAAVAVGNPDSYKSGFIDKSGKMLIELDGSPSEKGFSGGLAVVLKSNSSSYFYVDHQGRQIGGYYHRAEDCTEGLCAVRMDSMKPGSWGYANTDGEEVIRAQYDWALPFASGWARVGKVTGEPYLKDGAYAVEGKEGFIDRTGKALTPLKFDKARDFSNGMAQVQLGGKWGYIDETGQQVIAAQYDEAQAFQNDLARVKVNGLWGYIDKTGKSVIAPQYELAGDFYEDLAAVKVGGKTLYIDRTGKVLLSTAFEYADRFRNGLAAVRLNGKAGLINRAGKVVVELQFDSIEMVSDELIRVEDKRRGLGYIDYTGSFVWKPTY